MIQPPSSVLKSFLAVAALLGWFAVGCQFYLLMVNSAESVTESIIRFFSFFTILTNILVAVALTTLLLSPGEKFFSRSNTLTALAVYIGIVGMVYNLILRQLWSPQGLQLLVDELLHSVMPLLYLLFWFIVVPKNELKWKNVLPWLIYPLVYVVYVFIRGALSGNYPYPFMDVNKLGYGSVLLNSLMLTFVFVFFSLLLIAFGKITTNAKKA